MKNVKVTKKILTIIIELIIIRPTSKLCNLQFSFYLKKE
jgi:hypothetical protein